MPGRFFSLPGEIQCPPPHSEVALIATSFCCAVFLRLSELWQAGCFWTPKTNALSCLSTQKDVTQLIWRTCKELYGKCHLEQPDKALRRQSNTTAQPSTNGLIVVSGSTALCMSVCVCVHMQIQIALNPTAIHLATVHSCNSTEKVT